MTSDTIEISSQEKTKALSKGLFDICYLEDFIDAKIFNRIDAILRASARCTFVYKNILTWLRSRPVLFRCETCSTLNF